MNIFFMGTPEFAVPTLDILNKKQELLKQQQDAGAYAYGEKLATRGSAQAGQQRPRRIDRCRQGWRRS